MRLDAALGTSSWVREHLDHHLPILLSDGAPFKGCSIKNGHADREYCFPLEDPARRPYVDENS